MQPRQRRASGDPNKPARIAPKGAPPSRPARGRTSGCSSTPPAPRRPPKPSPHRPAPAAPARARRPARRRPHAAPGRPGRPGPGGSAAARACTAAESASRRASVGDMPASVGGGRSATPSRVALVGVTPHETTGRPPPSAADNVLQRCAGRTLIGSAASNRCGVPSMMKTLTSDQDRREM